MLKVWLGFVTDRPLAERAATMSAIWSAHRATIESDLEGCNLEMLLPALPMLSTADLRAASTPYVPNGPLVAENFVPVGDRWVSFWGVWVWGFGLGGVSQGDVWKGIVSWGGGTLTVA